MQRVGVDIKKEDGRNIKKEEDITDSDVATLNLYQQQYQLSGNNNNNNNNNKPQYQFSKDNLSSYFK